jgi:hypothetical protein
MLLGNKDLVMKKERIMIAMQLICELYNNKKHFQLSKFSKQVIKVHHLHDFVCTQCTDPNGQVCQ